jgi:multiple sugar transport system permease protein
MAGSRTVGARFAPWLILAPAVLLVLTFKYYPLGRGAVMAFQDYKITLPSKFIGLENFILVFLDKSFWVYLTRTFEFSFFTLLFGFTSPIILAILLSEIPIGKVFFRVVFYLPTISSAIVVMLVWKLMYEPTEFGFLNQLVNSVRAGLMYIRIDDAAAYLHLTGFAEWLQSTKPIDWLGNPYSVMICVIIPSVWAAMGAACLIYLAALKTVPDDLYDAAAIDGAGIWGRLRNVTLPFLKPLIIINFVGAFIGTFLGMGNIFVMTGGGPGDRTMVLSLAIWYRAFATLQFGIATAMAWVLGSLLIGFTVYQLKFLQKVEFRRLEEN